MTQRLFLALFPPQDVLDRLIDEMKDWPGINWQGEDQLHLTLRFLGDVDRRSSAELVEALAEIEFHAFDVALEGGDAFRRKGRPHAIYRRVKPSEPLARLVKAIDRRCEMVGLGRRDRRFLPHVTLARLGASALRLHDVEAYISSIAGLAGPCFTADRFTLTVSHLGHTGAIYEPLVDFPAVNAVD